jgi:hypothetical protein
MIYDLIEMLDISYIHIYPNAMILCVRYATLIYTFVIVYVSKWKSADHYVISNALTTSTSPQCVNRLVFI